MHTKAIKHRMSEREKAFHKNRREKSSQVRPAEFKKTVKNYTIGPYKSPVSINTPLAKKPKYAP